MNAPDELRAALYGAAEDFETLRAILSQIGAVLAHAKDSPRAADLIELAQYVADDWAETADTMRTHAENIAASVTGAPAIPTRVTVHRTRAQRATAPVGGNCSLQREDCHHG